MEEKSVVDIEDPNLLGNLKNVKFNSCFSSLVFISLNYPIETVK
ncbi:hypothetical protein [Methanobrevibacter sp. TMH8]|nr:hypothetical protein [Methanobrevibacter sp. TMH8]